MKKVIVTGAGGFIGSALVKGLLDKGIHVYGISTSEEKMQKFSGNENFSPVIMDFVKYDTLAERIADDTVDVFYHCAWQGVFGSAFKDYTLQLNNANYAATALMEAKKMNCKKFVFVGTQNEFEIQSFIHNENFQPRFTCIYGASKLVAELICKTLAYNYDIQYSAGLLCMAYGENNLSNMVPNIVMNQLNQGVSPNLITGDNLYDLIYIDDIVSALIAIGERGVHMKSYYVGHRTLRTFKEIFTEIRDVLNPAVTLNFGAYADSPDTDYSLINLNALYNDTGFECTADFATSIQHTALWLKEQTSTS